MQSFFTCSIYIENQNEEIQKVKDEVQSLQKQILDRDKNICLHVDKERQGAM